MGVLKEEKGVHIPDGYLSPQTTIPAFAAMAPVWGTAFRKVKKTMERQSIPSLALCSAFSFLIMMFNVPVVGGSSAHAVGAVLIAILMGPWAAVISVSTALLIQAVVFGDGGILAYGMNCLNMAVIMPFAGYYIYKVILGKAQPGSKRGLVATFLGSYCGLNLAAFAAAVEFGIQPMLFHAADGKALYCPYPLSVSIPSMMFAHGLVAGPIEGIVTAAAVAYLVKHSPQLFQRKSHPALQKESFLKRYRAILVPLAIMIVLTPLGLLATGTAFGEYGAEEIKEQLGYVPHGLNAASEWWKALLPDYSLPAFGGSRLGTAGVYILSAIVGFLLIYAIIFISSRLALKQHGEDKKNQEN